VEARTGEQLHRCVLKRALGQSELQWHRGHREKQLIAPV